MPNSTHKPDPGKPSPNSDVVPKKTRDKLEYYRAEIAATRAQMEKDRRHRQWRKWIKMYAENTPSTDPNIDQIDVPILFANVNVLRSALTVNNPTFAINPRNEASAVPAMICEEVMNYEWYHHKHQEQIRRAIDDMLITGAGWVKMSYNLQYHGQPEDVPEAGALAGGNFSFAPFEQEGFSEGFDALVESAKAVISQDPGQFGEATINRTEAARQLAEEGGIILADHPVLERVSPFEMFVDSSATSMNNVQWIAQRVPVRRDVAEKNKLWPPRVRKQLSAGQKTLAQQDEGTDATQADPDLPNTPGGSEMEWVIVWELYDLQSGEWCQFDDYADDFLVAPEPMPNKMGQPFRRIVDYEVPDEFFPIGEIERVAPLQAELNKTRTQLINDRKQNKSKWMVDKRYLGDNGREGLKHVLTSSEDNLIASIELQGQGTDLSNIVQQVPGRELDVDLYNVGAAIRTDINDVTGVTDYQRGGGSTGASTATEAAIINDGALARLKEKQGRVEQFMGEAARGLLMLKLQYMSSKKTVRIIAGASSRFNDGARKYFGVDLSQVEEIFHSYGRDDLAGEFDLIVEAGSSSAFNATQRRRAAQEMLATALPMFGQGMVNEQEILKYYFEHGLEVPNAQRFLAQPQPQGPQGGTPYGAGAQAPPGAAGGLGGAPTTPEGALAPTGGIPESAIGPPGG